MTKNDPEHIPFPKDDCLYRIFWGGLLLVPKDQQSTRRVVIWLMEVDENGKDKVNKRIVQVIESAGAIPKLRIGTYWKNGRKVRAKRSWPGQKKEMIEIQAPAEWSIVNANSYIPDNSIAWIDRNDLALSVNPTNSGHVNGHMAPIVYAKTTTNERVAIPCYTVFQAFYGLSSRLCNSLLTRTWDTAKRQFISNSTETQDADGTHWHIDLAENGGISTVCFLCMINFLKAATDAANAIYPKSVPNRLGDVWINAAPPFKNQPFKLHAHVTKLTTSDTLLITDIVEFEFPNTIASITYSPPPSKVGDSTPSSQKPGSFVMGKPKGDAKTISVPVDSRPTKGYLAIPTIAATILGLPTPRRQLKTLQGGTGSAPKTTIPASPPNNVSVGSPNKTDGPPSAQFTPEQIYDVEDRFQQFRDAVESLMEEGIIDDITECPLVRSMRVGRSTYCRFPFSEIARPRPWSMVAGTPPRQRFAYVVELYVGARVICWIEVEATKHKRHHSVAVEMTHGESIDQDTLEKLLIHCANNEGVWPKTQPFGEGKFAYVLARHSSDNHVLKSTYIRRAIAFLANRVGH